MKGRGKRSGGDSVVPRPLVPWMQVSGGFPKQTTCSQKEQLLPLSQVLSSVKLHFTQWLRHYLRLKHCLRAPCCLPALPPLRPPADAHLGSKQVLPQAPGSRSLWWEVHMEF